MIRGLVPATQGGEQMRGSKADMETSIDQGGILIQEAVWGDIHVSFETFREALDTKPLHKGLPDD
jgi:hypothetical protein